MTARQKIVILFAVAQQLGGCRAPSSVLNRHLYFVFTPSGAWHTPLLFRLKMKALFYGPSNNLRLCALLLDNAYFFNGGVVTPFLI